MKKEQVCQSRLCCWEAFPCSVAVPQPVLSTVPRERSCSFCLRNSSQARPTHSFWSVSVAEQPPFILCTQSCLPNDSLPGKVFTTPRLMPSTFNLPVLPPEVIRGQMGNGNRVLRRENDSHCHALLDLCQSKRGEIVSLNCLFLSSTLI